MLDRGLNPARRGARSQRLIDIETYRTLAMLGLTYGLMHDRSTWTAALVAGAAAVAAYALPLKLNIVVAIAAAVAAGLMMEHAERAGRKLKGGA